jgi:hypothetical protein
MAIDRPEAAAGAPRNGARTAEEEVSCSREEWRLLPTGEETCDGAVAPEAVEAKPALGQIRPFEEATWSGRDTGMNGGDGELDACQARQVLSDRHHHCPTFQALRIGPSLLRRPTMPMSGVRQRTRERSRRGQSTRNEGN